MTETDYKYTIIKNKNTNKIYSSKIDLVSSSTKEDMSTLILTSKDSLEWKSLDWKEPPESYNILLKERCQQLRDKYPYLTIYYSGGPDSETVIESFVRNNIFIDEIVINRVALNKNECSNPQIDIGIKKLKKIQKLIPKTRITVNDITEKVILNFFNSSYWDTFPAQTGYTTLLTRLSKVSLARRGIKQYFYNDHFSGHIQGDAKTGLEYDPKTKDFYTRLNFGHFGQSGNWYDEWFFTTLDYPKLHIKQTHLVKNYFKKNKELLNNSLLLRKVHTRYTISEANCYEIITKLTRFPHDLIAQPEKPNRVRSRFNSI